VETLHIFRSRPDGRTLELIRAITPGEIRQAGLYEGVVDYDQLVAELFRHDRVITWW